MTVPPFWPNLRCKAICHDRAVLSLSTPIIITIIFLIIKLQIFTASYCCSDSLGVKKQILMDDSCPTARYYQDFHDCYCCYKDPPNHALENDAIARFVEENYLSSVSLLVDSLTDEFD